MKTPFRTAIGVGLTVGALLLTSCGSSDDKASTSTTAAEATTTTAAPSLEITDAWARQSPMATEAGAVYLTITSPVDDSLVGASVPSTVAAKTEIHETVMADDATSTTAMGDESTTTTAMGDESTTTTAMGDTTETTEAGSGSMTMQPVDAIELPAGEAVELKPGGYHIMLLELVEPLKVGDSVEVTLTFKVAGEKTVTAEVREG